jgi:hypothetical protein
MSRLGRHRTACLRHLARFCGSFAQPDPGLKNGQSSLGVNIIQGVPRLQASRWVGDITAIDLAKRTESPLIIGVIDHRSVSRSVCGSFPRRALEFGGRRPALCKRRRIAKFPLIPYQTFPISAGIADWSHARKSLKIAIQPGRSKMG